MMTASMLQTTTTKMTAPYVLQGPLPLILVPLRAPSALPVNTFLTRPPTLTSTSPVKLAFLESSIQTKALLLCFTMTSEIASPVMSANLATMRMGRLLVKTVPQVSSLVLAPPPARPALWVISVLTELLVHHAQLESIVTAQHRSVPRASQNTSALVEQTR